MGDGFDTGQKLIEAFCDIETLVAENERLRAAIYRHRGVSAAWSDRRPGWEEATFEADADLWDVLEEGNTDG
jgi:hypothetical protein